MRKRNALGPNGGVAAPGPTLYPPVQPLETEGLSGTQRSGRSRCRPRPPNPRPSDADYFITTERLTLNVISAPGFTTTW